MKKIVIAALMIFLLPLTLHATDYMTIEEIERIWGDDAENIVFPKTKPSPNRSMDITELIDEYAQSAEFIKTMQYLEPNEDFGGIMEGEHLLDIIQTDNTTESIWIWSRYYQLTGDNQYYQNILNSWQYIYR
ncbi:MAG: hypothetical protein GY855_01450, partial [candidate division Zixibacteria bacterium]|nr:hypothetical protein [candidate division Zixibacteria bacterium]